MPDIRLRISQLDAQLSGGSGNAALLYELGGLKLAVGDASGAVSAFEHCLRIAPGQAKVRNNLGVALLQAGRHFEAIANLESAACLDPQYHRPLVNLAKALREVGRAGEAVERARQALRLQPDYPPGLVNLGDALCAAGELEVAERVLEKAVRLAPGLVEASVSLAEVRSRLGRPAEAVELLRGTVARSPTHAEAHMALGNLLFAGGDWEAAWPHFEYRFGKGSRPVALRVPAGGQRWNGIPRPGLSLCLVGEGGLGDQIHFARYARVLADLGIRTTLQCQSRLVRLLSAANLADHVSGFERADAMGELPWIPLMSLPAWHRTRLDTVPAARGYLVAEPERISRWRAAIPRERPCIGLVWAGNPAAEKGDFLGRSPPFEALAPLLRLPGASFVSLQRGAQVPSADQFPPAAAVLQWPDLDSEADAFLDTAAVLLNIDLLVTSDTSVAHLAGALGVQTWLCLKRDPDWRWTTPGRVSPWYSTLRLFRQVKRGDWVGLYTEVASHLERFIARTGR